MKKVLSLFLLITIGTLSNVVAADLYLMCHVASGGGNTFLRKPNGTWQEKVTETTWKAAAYPPTVGAGNNYCQLCQTLLNTTQKAAFQAVQLDSQNIPMEEGFEEGQC